MESYIDSANQDEQLAWQIVESTRSNLFLTGRAGTGKTTFLRQLQQHLPKRMVVLAPTGIAAINAGGVTLHSFFQLPFAPFVPDTTFSQKQQKFAIRKQKLRLIRSLDVIVIDEISMVRADLLDAVDDTLRRIRRNNRPFGGVQMVLIGDLGQLSPVVKEEEWTMLSCYYDSPYFFSSRALRSTRFSVVELTHVYRQSDARFLDILNQIRENRADASVLQALNARYQPGFNPGPDEGYIQLMTHNAQAQAVNDRELEALPAKAFSYKAKVEGKFPEMNFPTDELLTLKEGAQVMFVKNDSSKDKRYYNGMIGRITSIGSRGFRVLPKDGDQEIDVGTEEWTNSRYVLNEKTKEIEEEVEGSFVQFPVKTAWAITIHKSQGLTFDRAIIDASHAFAHGQTYVALSRCRTLEGLVLSSPIPASAIIHDRMVDSFSEQSEELKPSAEQMETMQREYFIGLLDELFGFDTLTAALYSLCRLYSEHLHRQYPKATAEMKAANQLATEQITGVASRFRVQYVGMVTTQADYDTNAALQERIHKGAAFFLLRLKDLAAVVKKAEAVEIGNKEIKERYAEYSASFAEALSLHQRLLSHFSQKRFSTASFLHEKAMALLADKDEDGGKKKPAKPEPRPVTDLSEIIRKQLTAALKAWRSRKAKEKEVPLYGVLPNSAIQTIVDYCPKTPEELAQLPGFGPQRVENYGADIVRIVGKYV